MDEEKKEGRQQRAGGEAGGRSEDDDAAGRGGDAATERPRIVGRWRGKVTEDRFLICRLVSPFPARDRLSP